jgi:hypothetical protein
MMAASFSMKSIGSKSRCEVPIAPHRLEFDEDASVGAEADAVLGERGAEEIVAELLEAGAIVGGDPDVGVEIEAVELGLAGAAGAGVAQIRLVADAPDPCAGAGAEGDAALHGMKVNAGSVVLEPGLTDNDFAEMARHGVRHAKYGFGGYTHPRDGEPDVRRAQTHGLCVMSHSGGNSIPGSSPITHDVLLHLRPDVCGHVNAGTTSLEEAGLAEIVTTTDMALQIVQAGNLRSALHILDLARKHGALARVCLASDTPTGTGVMPLGVLKTVCEVASLGGLAPAEAIALATGNNASAFRLATGTIAVGQPADLVVCDAPAASLARDAFDAIARGDIPGISCVVVDGHVRVGRSRNTALAKRLATFTGVSVATGAH